MERICAALRPGKRLVEPFTGSAAVFLNTDYKEYLLADTNPDLINLYRQMIGEGESFIAYCRRFFTPAGNTADRYYELRDAFNACREPRRRSALFLYLNRHCYNGLCRYNSRGEFNTPFGRYVRPYFPEREMRSFIERARRAKFLNCSFEETMERARRGDIVYCDPPYAPLSRTAHFTDYHTGGFDWDDQERLAAAAAAAASRGARVVISNHDTRAIRRLYQDLGAHITPFKVQRNISCMADRRERVGELLAVFG